MFLTQYNINVSAAFYILFDLTFVLVELMWAVKGINKELGIKQGPKVFIGSPYG